MRDPKDAPTVSELLKSDAFAAVAKSIQVMTGNQFHVFDFLIVRCHWTSSAKREPFQSFQSFKPFQTSDSVDGVGSTFFGRAHRA
jgi:hypothetical protein